MTEFRDRLNTSMQFSHVLFEKRHLDLLLRANRYLHQLISHHLKSYHFRKALLWKEVLSILKYLLLPIHTFLGSSFSAAPFTRRTVVSSWLVLYRRYSEFILVTFLIVLIFYFFSKVQFTKTNFEFCV